MDFLLVPDPLTASETCWELAQRSAIGTEVCSFSVLSETLAERLPIEPSELEWDVSLHEQALEGVFWGRNAQTYKSATNAERKASIAFLLNHSSLCGPSEAMLPLANRNQRCYNNIVALVRIVEERTGTDQAPIFLNFWALISNPQGISCQAKNDRKSRLIIGPPLSEKENESVNQLDRIEGLVSFSDERLMFEQFLNGFVEERETCD